jgi:hypothetical protein
MNPMKRFGKVVCANGLLIFTLLAAPAAHAVCSFNVNVYNGGDASLSAQSFQVLWSQSQFQDAGAWHYDCGANGRPKCTQDQETVNLSNYPASQTFKAETGGCDSARTFKIVISTQTQTGTQTATIYGTAAATKDTTMVLNVTAAWEMYNGYFRPLLLNCSGSSCYAQ